MRRKIDPKKLELGRARARLERMSRAKIAEMAHAREAAIGIHPKFRNRGDRTIDPKEWERLAREHDDKFMENM